MAVLVADPDTQLAAAQVAVAAHGHTARKLQRRSLARMVDRVLAVVAAGLGTAPALHSLQCMQAALQHA